jgi:hypothetical protein
MSFAMMETGMTELQDKAFCELFLFFYSSEIICMIPVFI